MSRDKTIAEAVKALGTLPLKHQPGTQWEYGVSTDVLGRLVEVLSGKTFDAFLEERIFAPLDMKDTAFLAPKDKRDRFTTLEASMATGLSGSGRRRRGTRPAPGSAACRCGPR